MAETLTSHLKSGTTTRAGSLSRFFKCEDVDPAENAPDACIRLLIARGRNTYTKFVEYAVKCVFEQYNTDIEKAIRPPLPVYSIAVQEWEGVVKEVREDYFVARLIDLTGNREDEDMEIPIKALTRDDRDLLQEGAVFYWSISYRYAGGEAPSVSMIKFRRLQTWTKEEIETANEEARNRLRFFLDSRDDSKSPE